MDAVQRMSISQGTQRFCRSPHGDGCASGRLALKGSTWNRGVFSIFSGYHGREPPSVGAHSWRTAGRLKKSVCSRQATKKSSKRQSGSGLQLGSSASERCDGDGNRHPCRRNCAGPFRSQWKGFAQRNDRPMPHPGQVETGVVNEWRWSEYGCAGKKKGARRRPSKLTRACDYGIVIPHPSGRCVIDQVAGYPVVDVVIMRAYP